MRVKQANGPVRPDRFEYRTIKPAKPAVHSDLAGLNKSVNRDALRKVFADALRLRIAALRAERARKIRQVRKNDRDYRHQQQSLRIEILDPNMTPWWDCPAKAEIWLTREQFHRRRQGHLLDEIELDSSSLWRLRSAVHQLEFEPETNAEIESDGRVAT
jgi:hypothetical protein